MKTKVKSLLQISLFLIAFVLALSLVRSILKITGSGQKITDASQKVDKLRKENETLTYQLELVESTQFIEKEARDKLGVAKKGEIVVVLPDKETLKAFAPKLEEKRFSLPIPVWQKWFNLFFDEKTPQSFNKS